MSNGDKRQFIEVYVISWKNYFDNIRKKFQLIKMSESGKYFEIKLIEFMISRECLAVFALKTLSKIVIKFKRRKNKLHFHKTKHFSSHFQ